MATPDASAAPGAAARPTGSGYRIEQFRIGPAANFGYLVIDVASGLAATIDPAWDAEEIRRRADAAGARIAEVWLTHSHADHVNALDAFAGLPIHLSRAEAGFWTDAPEAVGAATLHDDGDVTVLGGTAVTWRVTPGHTPGSTCLVLERDALTADTLFVYGCGRCDLPGSDPEAMYASLARLKSLLDDDVAIRPGHDYGSAPLTSMADQKAGNPFLMFDDEAAFVRYRMHDHGTLRSQPYGPETAPYPDA